MKKDWLKENIERVKPDAKDAPRLKKYSSLKSVARDFGPTKQATRKATEFFTAPEPRALDAAGTALGRAVARIVDREMWQSRLWIWFAEVPEAVAQLKKEGYEIRKIK